jgi:hypothetical protein
VNCAIFKPAVTIPAEQCRACLCEYENIRQDRSPELYQSDPLAATVSDLQVRLVGGYARRGDSFVGTDEYCRIIHLLKN